ncbi:MAG: hypothetical protein HQ503_09370 [Rhodospirillales bacterium]|nr:hypothetical protein [Rhodospirillales bacterium]
MSTQMFPDAFMNLAEWGDEWVIADVDERYLKRINSKLDKIREFYQAVFPRLKDIMEYLDQYPLDGMPPEAKRLFDLALTAMEMSHPIDLNWSNSDIDDHFPSERYMSLPVLRLADDGLPE